MLKARTINTACRRAAPIAAIALLAAGCGSASKTSTAASTTSSTMTSTSRSTGAMSIATTQPSSSAAAAAQMRVDGVTPVPTQMLGTADWQGMKIIAEAMTAMPFVTYNGTTEKMVKAGAHTSFHLMVMLNDADTGVAIPYASVWATFTKAGKVVYDERQWPMIARYMGAHYGNDITLPGAGDYQLGLLVSPPVSARHVEYKNIWLKPHRLSFTFHWSR